MLQDVVDSLEAASSAVSLTGDEMRAVVSSLHGLLESSFIDQAIIDRIEAARSEALDVLNVEIESAVAGIAHILMVESRRVESAIYGDSDSATGDGDRGAPGGWGVPPPLSPVRSPNLAGERGSDSEGDSTAPAGLTRQRFGVDETRPIGWGGLVPPADADQAALESRLPRWRRRFPSLLGKDWIRYLNDGGDRVSGRWNNCLDCSLSFLATWFGDPTVSASRTEADLTGEIGGDVRATSFVGAPWVEYGKGLDGLRSVRAELERLGPGSAAVLWTGNPGGTSSHAWNVVNDGGTVVFVDPQSGYASRRGDMFRAPYVTFVRAIVVDRQWSPGGHS
jgi:hypothetical protein